MVLSNTSLYLIVNLRDSLQACFLIVFDSLIGAPLRFLQSVDGGLGKPANSLLASLRRGGPRLLGPLGIAVAAPSPLDWAAADC